MAEKISVNVPHNLSVLDAKSRIDGGFSKVQDQIGGQNLNFEQSWNGDTMSFTGSGMGMRISGELFVEEKNVRVELELPWLLAKLSGTIQEKLKHGTQILLDKK